MTKEEFEEAWDCIGNKLTDEEQELIKMTIEGASVNHSVVYMVISSLLGVLAGGLIVSLF